MGTQPEYTAVANALLALIQGDINAEVPSMFKGMIPADIAPKMAGQLAKSAVDTLDAFRAKQTPPTPTPEQAS